MSGPGATDKKETKAQAVGWTDLEFWLKLPPAGADGQPVLVKGRVAAQPGDVYVQMVNDYRVDPTSKEGGVLTRGLGPSHFVGQVKGLSFCQGWGPWKSCFDAYGLSQDPNNSRLLLDGHYSGIPGSFIEVFGGRDRSQPIPGVFPYGTGQDGALLCEADQGGTFAHFADRMNHPPAEQILVDSKLWNQGRQWFQETRGGLCLPEGVEVHLPAKPLDLVKEVRGRGVSQIVFADPKAPEARMTLPKGASLVFRSGKNEVDVDWQLVRNPDGSLQGYSSVATEMHPSEVVVPEGGVSWNGEVATKSLTVAQFSPITTVQDLLRFLLKRPIDLIAKTFHSSETKITGPMTLILPPAEKGKSPNQVTLAPGKGESIFSVFTVIEGSGTETLTSNTKITKACWDFDNITMSADLNLKGALRGCFEGSTQVKASFDGYRLATLSVEFKGTWDGLDFPLLLPLGCQRTTFSGEMTGSATFVNLETDPLQKPRLALLEGSQARLVNGQLVIHPKGAKDTFYDINPQHNVTIEFKEGKGGLELTVGSLTIHDFVVTPYFTFPLEDAEGKAIAWEQCPADMVKGRCLSLEKIANPVLRSIIDIAGPTGNTMLMTDYDLTIGGNFGKPIADNFATLDMGVFNLFKSRIVVEPPKPKDPPPQAPNTNEYEQ